MIQKASPDPEPHVQEWIRDFDTYKAVAEQFRKGLRFSFRKKPKPQGSHVLKERLGSRAVARFLTELIPASDLAHRLGRDERAVLNQYLDENEQDILRYGYVSEEFLLDHRTKTSAKGGALVKVVSYFPSEQGLLAVSNFLKVFNSKTDYRAARATEERLAPLLEDLLLPHSYADDKNLVMAYPFIEGQTLFDRLKELSEEKNTLIERAADMLVEVHLRGRDETSRLENTNPSPDFRKYFFERAYGKRIKKDESLNEIINEFDRVLGQPLAQERQSLVHGDAKTKNFLLDKEKLWLIDPELARKDTIHYDLYRLIDSSGADEDLVLKRAFERLSSENFYGSDYSLENFRFAYQRNKVVGDFVSSARILEIARGIDDINQREVFSKIASCYFTKALHGLEQIESQRLSTKIREYVRDREISLEVLSTEQLALVSGQYDPSIQGLATMLSGDSQLRFPREKRPLRISRRAAVLGITGALLLGGVGAVKYLKSPSSDKDPVVDMDLLLEQVIFTGDDILQVKKDPVVDKYHVWQPLFYDKSGFRCNFFIPAKHFHLDFLYNPEEVPHNPTILSDQDYLKLFSDFVHTYEKISDNWTSGTLKSRGLTKLLEEGKAFSYTIFPLIVESVVFTNLLDTPCREEYIREGCSPLTLLPDRIYEQYGFDRSKESFENGDWIRLMNQYLKTLMEFERGDIVNTVIAYYNHQEIKGNAAYGLFETDRMRTPIYLTRNLTPYQYGDSSREYRVATRYDEKLPDSMKFLSRQALLIIDRQINESEDF